jgi:hypothetical protein
MYGEQRDGYAVTRSLMGMQTGGRCTLRWVGKKSTEKIFIVLLTGLCVRGPVLGLA